VGVNVLRTVIIAAGLGFEVRAARIGAEYLRGFSKRPACWAGAVTRKSLVHAITVQRVARAEVEVIGAICNTLQIGSTL
jgi:hypothetical protein